jgi:hypothetical protein
MKKTLIMFAIIIVAGILAYAGTVNNDPLMDRAVDGALRRNLSIMGYEEAEIERILLMPRMGGDGCELSDLAGPMLWVADDYHKVAIYTFSGHPDEPGRCYNWTILYDFTERK